MVTHHAQILEQNFYFVKTEFNGWTRRLRLPRGWFGFVIVLRKMDYSTIEFTQFNPEGVALTVRLSSTVSKWMKGL
jgi:hypothetical protein